MADTADSAAVPGELGILQRNAAAFVIYNRFKTQQCLEEFTEVQRAVFRLLPWLLHTPGPERFRPGKAASAPCGIHGYRWDPAVREDGEKHLPGERFERPAAAAEPAIEFLSLMGSAGSIAYNDNSDLDFWCCVRDGLPDEAVARLRWKLDELESWCNDDLKVEVHVFIVRASTLRANDFGELTQESCGSALGSLLKEEYYRGSLLLAGRIPYWWVVPPGVDDAEYARLVGLAEAHAGRIGHDFIDIGNIVTISLEEMIGGSLWQINKSIGSCFKSLLKLALLLAYSDPQARSRLLATELKELVQTAPNKLEFLDAYQLMLDRILAYYTKDGRLAEADLLRRAFFLKIRPSVLRWIRSPNPPRRHADAVMVEYCRAWTWSEEEIALWERFEELPIQEALRLKAQVEAFWMDGMRRLQDWAAGLGLTQTIRRGDFLKMFCRLQSVFGHDPGHCEWFYPPFDAFLRDRRYTLRRVEDGCPGGASVRWELYRGVHDPAAPVTKLESRYLLRTAGRLADLLGWMLANGLVQDDTRLVTNLPEADAFLQNMKALACAYRDRFGRLHLPGLDSPAFAAPPAPARFLLHANGTPGADRGLRLKDRLQSSPRRPQAAPAGDAYSPLSLSSAAPEQAAADPGADLQQESRRWLGYLLSREQALPQAVSQAQAAPSPAAPAATRASGRLVPVEPGTRAQRLLSADEDPLNAWEDRVSLVSEAFLLDEDTWGARAVRTYDGPQWLAEVLARILSAGLSGVLDPARDLEVSLARWTQDAARLKGRLKGLVTHVSGHFLGGGGAHHPGTQPVYFFEMDGLTHLLFRQGNAVSCGCFRDLRAAAAAACLLSPLPKRPAFDPGSAQGPRYAQVAALPMHRSSIHACFFQEGSAVALLMTDSAGHLYGTVLPPEEMRRFLPRLVLGLCTCLGVTWREGAVPEGLRFLWAHWKAGGDRRFQDVTEVIWKCAAGMSGAPLSLAISSSTARVFLLRYATEGRFCFDTAEARQEFLGLLAALEKLRRGRAAAAAPATAPGVPATPYRVYLTSLLVEDDGIQPFPTSPVARLHLKMALEEALTLQIAGRLLPDKDGGFTRA